MRQNCGATDQNLDQLLSPGFYKERVAINKLNWHQSYSRDTHVDKNINIKTLSLIILVFFHLYFYQLGEAEAGPPFRSSEARAEPLVQLMNSFHSAAADAFPIETKRTWNVMQARWEVEPTVTWLEFLYVVLKSQRPSLVRLSWRRNAPQLFIPNSNSLLACWWLFIYSQLHAADCYSLSIYGYISQHLH